ncbi:helix-turn-helix transcriptional regulator [Shewanella nanhaiensis]|uniref:AlpA family phage regulatory protein n=1 Tax=Shewanella nanhaiensis TaxID=2864872 RepID=A0ABS7EA60_9GAMM|nr:AlpA family phage regulatory protein [Shewanella nanhaiensis]MBW8186579.1 AlpA family phage regulatory protein [Shewanella nanhaiensis]
MKTNSRILAKQLLELKKMERIIRIQEMSLLLGIDRTTLYRRVKRNTFIQPIKSQNRTIGWPESSYANWIETQKQ